MDPEIAEEIYVVVMRLFHLRSAIDHLKSSGAEVGPELGRLMALSDAASRDYNRLAGNDEDDE